MRENTILFPIYGTLYPYRMSHHGLWLAHYLPAKLCLMEVLLPTGWLRWLLSFFSREDREWRLHEVERLVFQQDQVKCETATLKAPNLTIGIVEAAWRLRPNLIVIMPELQEVLGKSGLTDLKTRLGEMGRCTLVLLRNGPAIRLEPCNPMDSLDTGRVIHAKFG
jgi:hypothetical protein